MIRELGEKKPKIHPTAYISEAAYVVGDVEIGENSSAWPGAVIRGDFGKIVIGRNTHIEDNCVIHTPDGVEIGDNVIIGHSATIHCKKVGSNCLIGIGAMLLNDSEIGEECIIAGGSLVSPNTKVPNGSLYMGSPARLKERLSEKRLAELHEAAEAYSELAAKYRQLGYQGDVRK